MVSCHIYQYVIICSYGLQLKNFIISIFSVYILYTTHIYIYIHICVCDHILSISDTTAPSKAHPDHNKTSQPDASENQYAGVGLGTVIISQSTRSKRRNLIMNCMSRASPVYNTFRVPPFFPPCFCAHTFTCTKNENHLRYDQWDQWAKTTLSRFRGPSRQR